jgi:hypothetical protein
MTVAANHTLFMCPAYIIFGHSYTHTMSWQGSYIARLIGQCITIMMCISICQGVPLVLQLKEKSRTCFQDEIRTILKLMQPKTCSPICALRATRRLTTPCLDRPVPGIWVDQKLPPTRISIQLRSRDSMKYALPIMEM